MSFLFRTTQPFLQLQSWQTQALNALRYNTSQVGSVVPMIYGTMRQPVNLLAFGGYQGPGGGKKGKGVGPLPIGGTQQSSKGGGGGKKGGKKSAPDYSINVDFGLCEGPVTIGGDNGVWASAEVTTFGGLPLNQYDGSNGQAPDGTFAGIGNTVGYSGTCHVTATPMDLGSSPVLPNLSIEITGFCIDGTMGVDANPGLIITHFLTDPQRGAGFPSVNLDDMSNFTLYCNQVGFGCSMSLDGQQSGLEWLGGFVKLLNTAMVWSGSLLKFIPYGDLTVGTWNPNLVAQYAINDDDFLTDWKEEAGPDPNKTDPVITTRINPVDASNWISIEYTDRTNNYNSTIISAFDQSAIDAYGLRTGDNLSGKQFCSAAPAQTSSQIYIQRLQYIRNTPYKFKLGWRFALLEPMDLLLLTGNLGDNYLNNQAVRILSIEEDDNGDLTIEAEQLEQGSAHL